MNYFNYFFCLILTFYFIKNINAASLCSTGTIAGPDPSKCYQYFKTSANYINAQTKCLDNGEGNLASPKNGFINTFVSEIARGIISDNGAQIWLGSTIDAVNYTNWAKGEPSLSDGCVVMQISTSYWYAKTCDTLFPYFCEVSAAQCPNNHI